MTRTHQPARPDRARVLAGAAGACLLALATAGCTETDSAGGPAVAAGLLQPGDLPAAPESADTETELPDAAGSWACGGVEQNVLLEAGWDQDVVVYRDVDGHDVASALYTSADNPAAAVQDIRSDVTDCIDRLTADGEPEAMAEIDVGDARFAYESFRADDQSLEGARAYGATDGGIVQVTILSSRDDDPSVSIQTLLDRAVSRAD